jgi:1-deoxy-D-xylulose-5-phosphate synthase
VYLEEVNSPDDLKKIEINNLSILCKEIREFLVTNIGNTGGHLSSNLGVVELTVAMHYVFNSPIDKIIFDVSHQSYVHKILTGRKEEFKNLRKQQGMSGFTNRQESEHDTFTIGHSSTSIAMASGLAVARDLKKDKSKIIALIADGALTGGLAYEALNNISNLNTSLIVILNDNNMSISKSVGALTKYLNRLRVKKNYYKIKDNTKVTIEKIPIIGKFILKKLSKTKRYLKYSLINTSTIFEEFGFKYIGPINGHNIEEMINIFEIAKKIKGPVLIHVKTCKGKGYSFAEKNPTKFHGVSKFNYATGKLEVPKMKTYSMVAGDTLTKIADTNKDLVVITAAMTDGTGVRPFIEKHPTRFFDVGIAEEYAISFAAGLSALGLKPVFMVYSTFLQRGYDQILHDICLNNLPMIFLIDRAGIVGQDGKTHQGIYDISMLSSIPNLSILSPRNIVELENMIEYAVNQDGPVAIRYPKGTSADTTFNSYEKIKKGKFEILNLGSDIAIFGLGSCFEIGEKIYIELRKRGLNVSLINPRFVYPLDDENLKLILSKHRYILTIEDGIKDGGFASKISSFILENRYDGKILLSYGYPKDFIEHGKREDIMKNYGLDKDNIINDILTLIDNNQKNNNLNISS